MKCRDGSEGVNVSHGCSYCKYAQTHVSVGKTKSSQLQWKIVDCIVNYTYLQQKLCSRPMSWIFVFALEEKKGNRGKVE